MKGKRLRAEDISFYCMQFSIILNAGLSLHDGVESIIEDVENPAQKKIVKKISDVLNDEKPLYMALESTNSFPDYVINMVKIGELSGRLEEVLNNLSEYYDNESEVKASIKEAVIQPLVLMIMMFMVVAVLVAKIIPVFSDIFKQFDPEIEKLLSTTVNTTKFIGAVVLTVLAVVIVVLVVFLVFSRIKSTKKIMQLIFSKLHVTKGIYMLYAKAQFAMGMSLMIKSGLDTLDALSYARKLNSNEEFAKKIDELIHEIENNTSFPEAISKVKVFDGMHTQIIKVAYRTGAYEAAWTKISEKYHENFQRKIQNVVALIEPTFVAILTLVIGIILVSVMLPLVQIMGNII